MTHGTRRCDGSGAGHGKRPRPRANLHFIPKPLPKPPDELPALPANHRSRRMPGLRMGHAITRQAAGRVAGGIGSRPCTMSACRPRGPRLPAGRHLGTVSARLRWRLAVDAALQQRQYTVTKAFYMQYNPSLSGFVVTLREPVTETVKSPCEILADNIGERFARQRRLPEPRKCEVCRREYTPLREMPGNPSTTCSPKCRVRKYRGTPDTSRQCEHCNAPMVNPRKGRVYCDGGCRARACSRRSNSVSPQ